MRELQIEECGRAHGADKDTGVFGLIVSGIRIAAGLVGGMSNGGTGLADADPNILANVYGA